MPLVQITPNDRIVGLLRQNLTDYQSGRSDNWIYPSRPEIEELINDTSNFPIISVEDMQTAPVQVIGVNNEEIEERVQLLINVWCVRRQFLDVVSTIDESTVFALGTAIYPLINIPYSTISSVTGTLSTNPHTFVQDIDYEVYDNDGDGLYDSIRWLGLDEPDDTTAFLVTYERTLGGQDLAKYIAIDVNKYLRENWKTDIYPILYDYKRIAMVDIKFEQQIGIFRCELQIEFKGLNIGD